MKKNAKKCKKICKYQKKAVPLHRQMKKTPIRNPIRKPKKTKIMKATLKKLLKDYDNANQIAKDHFKKCEVLMNRVWRDSMTDEEYEAECAKALFLAGLTDREGCTDVYEKERIARKQLLDCIFNILPTAEREILKANRYNVTQMDKVIEIARRYAK